MRYKLKNLVKKITWILLQCYKIFLNQLNNSPFISGDNFKGICDIVISKKDLGLSKTTRKIHTSNSLFIEGHLLEELIRFHAPALETKIVVSGNSDQNFKLRPNFPHRPQFVYCQNLADSTDAIYKTLPIGIENLRLGRSGFKHLHKPRFEFEITDKVLLPPMSPTHESRIQILEVAKKRSEIFNVEEGLLPTSEYFKLLRKYKFVFVCEGNGFDTHRLWEVLYQNSFPIILESEWAKSLSWLNLPILMISKIEDLNQTLIENHNRMHSEKQPSDYPTLWMPYWDTLINSMTMNES